MEFFLAEVKTPSERLSTTTLIRETLGEIVPHNQKELHCLSIVETAAEKWVALTRRVATIDYRQSYQDQTLVRHLYDLHQIYEKGKLDDRFFKLISGIVNNDREQFKNHNEDYAKNPVNEIKRALFALRHDTSWHKHWDNFIGTMVYQQAKPNYEHVLTQFEKHSNKAIQSLEKSFTLKNTGRL